MVVDKSKIKPQANYMKCGGNQIIEIMEREFSLEYIEKNSSALKIDYYELQGLRFWLSCNTNLNQTKQKCKEFNEQNKGRYQKFGLVEIKSILSKLYKKINIVPVFDDSGEIVDKYSFLDYSVIDIKDTNYRVVIPKVNMDKFSNKWYVYKYLKQKLERVIVLKFEKGAWKEVRDKFSREYKHSLKVLDKLVI